MKLDDLVAFPKLLAGTAITMVSAAAADAADTVERVVLAEPTWLPLALKFTTLFAGLTTIAAGCVKIYLDLAKARQEAADRKTLLGANSVEQKRHEYQRATNPKDSSEHQNVSQPD